MARKLVTLHSERGIATRVGKLMTFRLTIRFSKDFTSNTAPMPLVFMIAACACDVKQDSAKTGLSEVSLHKIPGC